MQITKKFSDNLANWTKEKFLQVSVFNIIIIILFLMRSAGYFDPYFLISVNFIIIVSLLLSIVLLGSGSRTIFVVSLVFWLFAGFLRLLNLDVWAERTAVYAYESLFLVEVYYQFFFIQALKPPSSSK